VLQAILLRRTKTTKLNGEPIVQLPGREAELVKVSTPVTPVVPPCRTFCGPHEGIAACQHGHGLLLME
jgi:hypothetical protein